MTVALVVALVGGTVLAVPAYAADASLTIEKTVNDVKAVTIANGDEFQYAIQVGCDDNDCADAKLVDPLPAEFDGFEILGTSVTPASQPATKTLTGCSTTVSANCLLEVTFEQALEAGGVGIGAGRTYLVTVSLKAPQSLTPSWTSNDVAVPNTATATSSTAPTVTSTADVTVSIPVAADVQVGKTWTPANQQFAPGTASTVDLTVKNTSNVLASSLTLQDPVTADDSASTLDAANPFAVVDFAGFGAVTLPAGADTVQVDAYVPNAGATAWHWATGPPTSAAGIQLPAGVNAGDIAGLRFTFTSSTGATIAVGGAADVPVNVVQRATNRISNASLVSGATVTNKVSGSVAVPGQAVVTKQAQAPYTIGALNVKVSAGKTISPSRIPAGTTATATITGKNGSNGPLSSLTLSDLGYFTDTLAFGGFSAPLSYPTGATGASIVWYFSAGTPVTDPVANGGTPIVPAPAVSGAHLTGFELQYTGAIAAGVTATAQFAIAPTSDFVAVDGDPVGVTNTLGVGGTNAAGSATASATAPLTIFYPEIKLVLSKSLKPGGAVAPGATVVAQLPTTTSTDSAYVRPTTITVADEWRNGTAGDFFNAFNPIAVAPTQVPLGATLQVEYTTDGGTTYTTLPAGDGATAQIFRATFPAADIANITGVRFIFTKADGFAQGTPVTPAVTFQARATLRSDGQPTSVPDAAPSVYENLGTADATAGPGVKTTQATATATGSIVTHSGDNGSLGASKKWTKPDLTGSVDILDSQSGEQAGTVLDWGVTDTGYSSVVVSDPASNPDQPATTIFNAFDLKRIAPVSFLSQPLLRWDQVTAIELYRNGAWTPVPKPSGDWMTASGFAGYTLTDAESATATGVRITVEPDDAARRASTDALTAPVGSGIATVSSTETRSFGLVWQLRNVVRVDTTPSDPWVTSHRTFNDTQAGAIWNRSSVSGVQNGSPVGPVGAEDNVSLIDHPPVVNVTKTSARSTIVVPKSTDVDPGDYPRNDFTVVATNGSSSRASYLRVTDPSPCATGAMGDCVSDASAWAADPFAGKTYTDTSPYERLNLTKITFSVPADQVDANASLVTLWHRAADGTLSTSVVTMTAAAALSPADLLDVVGVSVVYQGTDPAADGGSIVSGTPLTMTLSTQVRVTQRSDPDQDVTAIHIDTEAFSQSYDPVLYPSGQQSRPSDSDDADLTLTTGVLDVTAAKSFSVPSLLERDRHNPVAVTLTATQGSASVATNQLTVTDDDQAFWNNFTLTAFNAADVTMPAGADQVRVDVQTGGSATWIAGTPAATAALPTIALDQVTGIRFVFMRADGGLFSRMAVPDDYTARAVLRVQLLDAARDGSAIAFPSTLSDTVAAVSHRTDDPAVFADAVDDATADILLLPGTFSLDVAKTPAGNTHTVSVGDPNTWTVTFANTGTGYLDVTDLVDTLPASLAWDGEAPAFSTTTGGTLSLSPAVALDAGTGRLTLTWPAGGARMSPGERFTIGIGLVLQPGLSGTQRATNQLVVTTAQTLIACTNTSGNGQGTLSGLAANQCGTTNFVQPVTGPSLFTVKGVKGDVVNRTVSGAVNPSAPAATCTPDVDGYYTSPCAANTVVGATDEWRVRAINSGTVTYDSLVFVEPLPHTGDRMLATGSSRGSTYRPVFDPTYGLSYDAPAGTTVTWQVTTADSVCLTSTGTTAWPTDPTCDAHPVAAEWIDSTVFAASGDWSAVTGIRVTMDFSTTATHTLEAGGIVTARYRTVNRPATATETDGAPVSIASSASFAWNQFGATAALTGGGEVRRAPVKAGVTLATGPLQIDKLLTGSAVSAAPDEFLADVACTVAGAPVDLGSSATSVLAKATGYTVRIDGIPVGADCTVAEAGAPGSYGEAGRSISTGAVAIGPAGVGGAVPSAQIVTITNTYEFGQLTIAKTANTAAVDQRGEVTYTIAVANVGALDATDFDVVDTLPAGSTYVSSSAGGIETNGVVTWPISALQKGDRIALQVTLSFADAGDFVNRATVTTPPVGPWTPPLVSDACGDDPDSSCAAVVVTDPPAILAKTGSAIDGWLIAAWGTVLTLLGAALVARRTRRRAG
ncbi:DUF5979 domain-containing protein [Leifsonia sp. NPDC058230]|uniref:DUF5979 domain-containing protein n=1 Tax=Leifsonia sp. NPDC058230 TaxID=3346391 RepID=UPI0036DD2AD2